jgi:hypothetical protein
MPDSVENGWATSATPAAITVTAAHMPHWSIV